MVLASTNFFEWLVSHPQIAFVIIAIVATWVGKLKKRVQGSEARKPQPSIPTRPVASPHPFGDAANEQMRRVQEEIRRKIQERARKQVQPAPSPVLRPTEAAEMPRPTEISRRQPVPPPLPEKSLTKNTATMLVEEMNRLEERKRETRKIAKAAAQERARIQAADTDAQEIQQPMSLRGIAADLSDPAQLRRAIILNEVLGTPVGLRR